MTKRIEPTCLQYDDLSRVCRLVEERAGRRVEATLELLRQAGFEPYWRRVVWTGGIGSYRWMPRRRRYRILVAATKSGVSTSTIKQIPVMPGVVDTILIPGKRRGFRYGWCVEC
ncbi:MAG: hypothetical protein ACLUNS_10215 [Alistipes shahii]